MPFTQKPPLKGSMLVNAGPGSRLLGHVKAPNWLPASLGDAGATAQLVPRWGRAKHQWMGRASSDGQSIIGWAEHHRTGRISLDGQNIVGWAEHRRTGRTSQRRRRRDAGKEQTLAVLPFQNATM